MTPLDKCPLMVPPVVHFPLTLFPVDIDGHIIDTFHINVLKDRQILVVFFLEILLNAVLFLHIVKTLSGSCCLSSFYSLVFYFHFNVSLNFFPSVPIVVIQANSEGI